MSEASRPMICSACRNLHATKTMNNPQPNNLIENPTLEQLRQLDENNMTVFYELIDGKPFARVYSFNDVPPEAIEYHSKVQRLAELNVLNLKNQNNTLEHHELRDWFKSLHPKEVKLDL